MTSSPPRSVVTLAGDERVELGVLHAEEPGCEGPYDVARPPFAVLSGRVVRERESVGLYVFSRPVRAGSDPKSAAQSGRPSSLTQLFDPAW